MTTDTKWIYPPNFDGFYEDDGPGHRRVIVQLSSVSGGVEEVDVAKIIKGDLRRPDGQVPNKLVVEKIEYHTQGLAYVLLEFDHSPDVHIATLPGGNKGCMEFPGGMTDSGEEGTGNITLTTSGATAGDMYNITLTVRLK